MIVVTRLTGERFGINSDLIQRVDSAPDTIVTLVDGAKYIVAEPLAELIDLMDERAARVLARAQDLRNQVKLAAVPDPQDDETSTAPTALAAPLPLRPRSV